MLKISGKNLIIVLILGLICFIFAYIEGLDSTLYSLLILINSWIAIYSMLKKSCYPYSIGKLANLFILVFFILANAIQFAHHSKVVTFAISFAESDYCWFQVLVCCILLSYNFIHDYCFQNYSHKSDNKNIYSASEKKLIAISVISFIILLAYNHFNIMTLLFRGMTSEMVQQYEVVRNSDISSSSALIFDKVLRPIPWCSFIVALCCGCSKRIKSLLFILALLSVSPIGVSRNAAAIYWLPVVIILFTKYIKGNRFIYLMLFGMFIVFPFMDNFRYFSGDIRFKFSMDYLDTMNMDASQMFMSVLKYDIVTYGRQLLGVALFWVPRSIWPTKPIGSGAFVAESCNGWFNNVSMPYFAEGYLNFGLLGLILFIIVAGIISGRLDARYWYNPDRFRNPNVGFYLIALGATIFIMRGDLLSSFAYTVGTLISYYIVVRLTVSKSRKIGDTIEKWV